MNPSVRRFIQLHSVLWSRPLNPTASSFLCCVRIDAASGADLKELRKINCFLQEKGRNEIYVSVCARERGGKRKEGREEELSDASSMLKDCNVPFEYAIKASTNLHGGSKFKRLYMSHLTWWRRWHRLEHGQEPTLPTKVYIEFL